MKYLGPHATAIQTKDEDSHVTLSVLIFQHIHQK